MTNPLLKNKILVDQGALQMLRNAVKRHAEEFNRPVLLEMLEEVDKTCVPIEDVFNETH